MAKQDIFLALGA